MEFMSETKPLLLIRKYRAVLTATVIVEVVAFLVSLTDSIVAGNIVGPEAFAATGIVSPFICAATFLTAMITSGTLMEFTRQIGLYNKRRAHEFFSQGVVLSVVCGAAFTLIVFLIKGAFISGMDISPSVEGYLNDYYGIIAFYFMLMPISSLLDNAAVADGDVKLTLIANITQIAANVALSVILGMLFGIKGIAIATVSSKLLFIALMSLWYVGKECTIRFIPRFSFDDSKVIITRGSVKASTYALTALMTLILNNYIINVFDIDTFNVWVIIQKVLGLQAVFLGQAMTLQPLLGPLMGEHNTKAIRILTGRSSRDILIAGVISALPPLLFTKTTLRIFGVTGGAVMDEGIIALRVTSLTLIFMAITIYFFVYYFLIDKYALSLIICFLKDLVCPVGLVVLLSILWEGHPNAIWIGLVIAAVAAMIISIPIVIIIYGRDRFPYLLERYDDSRIHIFAFYLEDEKIVEISKTAEELLRSNGYSRNLQLKIGVCIEDIFMLVKEKNSDVSDSLFAECTLIMEDGGVRLILRDTGMIFDLTDTDAKVASFLQYSVASMVNAIDNKVYVTTAGYNRNELFFSEDRGQQSKQ